MKEKKAVMLFARTAREESEIGADWVSVVLKPEHLGDIEAAVVAARAAGAESLDLDGGRLAAVARWGCGAIPEQPCTRLWPAGDEDDDLADEYAEHRWCIANASAQPVGHPGDTFFCLRLDGCVNVQWYQREANRHFPGSMAVHSPSLRIDTLRALLRGWTPDPAASLAALREKLQQARRRYAACRKVGNDQATEDARRLCERLRELYLLRVDPYALARATVARYRRNPKTPLLLSAADAVREAQKITYDPVPANLRKIFDLCSGQGV